MTDETTATTKGSRSCFRMRRPLSRASRGPSATSVREVVRGELRKDAPVGHDSVLSEPDGSVDDGDEQTRSWRRGESLDRPEAGNTLDGADSRARLRPAVRDRTRKTKERTMNDFTHDRRQNQVTTASRQSIRPARAASASIQESTRTVRETGGTNRGECRGA